MADYSGYRAGEWRWRTGDWAYISNGQAAGDIFQVASVVDNGTGPNGEWLRSRSGRATRAQDCRLMVQSGDVLPNNTTLERLFGARKGNIFDAVARKAETTKLVNGPYGVVSFPPSSTPQCEAMLGRKYCMLRADHEGLHHNTYDDVRWTNEGEQVLSFEEMRALPAGSRVRVVKSPWPSRPVGAILTAEHDDDEYGCRWSGISSVEGGLGNITTDMEVVLLPPGDLAGALERLAEALGEVQRELRSGNE